MIPIQDNEFYFFVDYLQENFGINLIKKRTLVESRLNNYLRDSGFLDYRTFLDHVFNDKSGTMLDQIINRLTTNYSYFMREWEHFEFFKNDVLPMIEKCEVEKDLRVWSAGCSTGQEPYMLAMIVADYFADKDKRWDKKILATDISKKALLAAEKGEYDDDSLTDVPPDWKNKYFKAKNDGKWEVAKRIKEEIIFRRFNLIEKQFPFRRKFHTIFCRNVMIYFDHKTKTELVKKFCETTVEGGYLFVGQAETLDLSAVRYKNVMPSVYRKDTR